MGYTVFSQIHTKIDCLGIASSEEISPCNLQATPAQRDGDSMVFQTKYVPVMAPSEQQNSIQIQRVLEAPQRRYSWTMDKF